MSRALWLAECASALDPEGVPLVSVYEVKGRAFLQMDAVNPPRAKKSKYPAPADGSVVIPDPEPAREQMHARLDGKQGPESTCEHLQTEDGTGESNGKQTLTNVPYSSSYSDSSSITPSLRSGVVQPAESGPDASGPTMHGIRDPKASEDACKSTEETDDGPNRAEVRRVYKYYLQTMGLQEGEYRLTGARYRKIRTRLTEFSPELLCDAIDACRASPWHMGDDPKNHTPYNDLEKNILPRQEKVEDWLRRRNGKAART